ncbi:hypothetical protein NC99_30500 [Sunxiuqinia dokdonensis]|uniref:Uncharacterized protein n=1 Tax=Sunxiuqinia dokdonensis TaxID=1409788 RepID=A0A0L8V771_9BACT|nr:hypothetical protein NC99_30500 [Sunxiuqinia dokdonensis]
MRFPFPTNRTILELKLYFSGKLNQVVCHQSHHTGIEIRNNGPQSGEP